MKKSEARRQAIMGAAAQVFQEAGYERTSMADISARVGYSKATLYSYFKSKDELFFEVVTDATEAEFQATHKALSGPVGDIAEALERFGQGLLMFIYSPQVRAVRRLVVSEAGRSDLGRRCYELGPARSNAALAQFLQKAMDAGKLRQADTGSAALHLKALLEAEWIDRFLFQTLGEQTAEQAADTAAQGVAIFMAAYGPNSSSRHDARSR